jgi:hypothetical protein
VRFARTVLARQPLEVLQQPAPEPEPTRRFREPHALDVGHAAGVMLDGAAADRFAAQVGDDERSMRRAHLVRLGGRPTARIEAAVRCPAVQLGHVSAQAPLRVLTRRVDLAQLDERRRDQPLHRAHRGDELGALPVVERREDR